MQIKTIRNLLLSVAVIVPASLFIQAQQNHWQEVKKEKLAMQQKEQHRLAQAEYEIASGELLGSIKKKGK